MESARTRAPDRVGLLFTRFPVVTETFLTREVEALRRLKQPLLVCALWPAGRQQGHGPAPDEAFHPAELVSLFWRIPVWTVRNPRGMHRLAEALLQIRFNNLTNILEGLLGLGYAICRADRLAKTCSHLHAAWASAPATAAWAVRQLTGLSYSMAGHAYDLFEDGGDALLEVKLPEAAFIRTSMESGRQRWIRLGADPSRVRVVRRGLLDLPPRRAWKTPAPPLRILAVGRLVEKMGYPELLEILALLRQGGTAFEATLVGGGPLRDSLEQRCRDLKLAKQVRFTGSLAFEAVEAHYAGADLFLFAGRVARSGDRAGFPNAIGEAMAWGLPVVATPVGAVREGIRDGETGLIYRTPPEAVARIQHLLENPEEGRRLSSAARDWVEREFNALENMRQLADLFREYPR